MPTTAITTFSNQGLVPYRYPQVAYATMQVVPIKASSTLAAGTILGEVTATGKFAAYASGNNDGTQVARGILQRAVVTDSSGNITNWSEWGVLVTGAPIYTRGDFKVADLTGLDATSLASLTGRYTQVDTSANGVIVHFG